MKNELNNQRVNNEVCAPATSGLRPFSAACLAKLQELKEVVTGNLAAEYGALVNHRQLQQVVNEADALAAFTPFPTLFLPTLAEEKVLAAAAWNKKQQALFAQNDVITLAA